MATVVEVEEAQAPPMATATATATARGDRLYRMTIDRYDRLVAAGVFREKEPIFLWKGHLVRKMTKNPPHDLGVTALMNGLVRIVPEDWHVRVEASMEIPDDSIPEPDLTIVRGSYRNFTDRRPTSAEVALIVEVSDTSLAEDQGEVLETYAEQSVPAYWIVNIPGRRIQVYTDPTGPGLAPTYRSLVTFQPGDFVPVILDGRDVGRIAVADVLA